MAGYDVKFDVKFTEVELVFVSSRYEVKLLLFIVAGQVRKGKRLSCAALLGMESVTVFGVLVALVGIFGITTIAFAFVCYKVWRENPG